MKGVLVLIILIQLTGLPTEAQVVPNFYTTKSIPNLYTDTTYNFTKYYFVNPSNSAMIVRSAAQLGADYFFAIAGDTDSTYYNLFILKTDQYGNLIKYVDLGRDSIAYPTYPGNTCIFDRDSNLLVCSNMWYYGSSGAWDGYVAKLNRDLDTLWTRIYALPPLLAGCQPGDNPVNYLTAICQTPDGGYIISGNYALNCIGSNQRSFLLKIDQDGNVQWWKAYTDVRDVFNIELSNDSGFLFTDFYSGTTINKTDSFGNIIWRKDPNTLWHLLSSDLCKSNNEIIAGFPHIYNNNISDPLYGLDLVRLNCNGDIIWNKQYVLFQTFECPELHQNFNIEILTNGDILICGTSRVYIPDSSKGGYKGVMLRLTSNGDSLWARYYQYGDFRDQCQFNDVLLANDGGFLAVGYHFPWDGSYNAGAWLVKTDSNGYAPGSYPTGIEKPAPLVSNITLYPNPANDLTNIGGLPPEFDWQDLELLIFDISGRLQKKLITRSSGGIVQINLTGLRKGVYFIQLALPGGGSVVRKLVKL